MVTSPTKTWIRFPPSAERVEGVEFRDFEKDEFSMPSQDGVVRDLSLI